MHVTAEGSAQPPPPTLFVKANIFLKFNTYKKSAIIMEFPLQLFWDHLKN